MSNKILICDDDEGILDLMEMFLTDEGYTVIAELNSIKVGGLIQREQPDLVILDLWMPVTSGDQILKMIRSTPLAGQLPVMIISASSEGESIARECGATAFIAKPFDLDKVISTISEMMYS